MAERTCCPTHTDTCRFGREHVWAGPFLLDGGRPVDGQVWSHPDDVHCAACAGTCTGNREEHPVADDADREQDARHARSRVVSRVIREHEERPMGCVCGAPIGDSIDRTWHLANQVAEAVAAHVRQEVRERIAQDIEADRTPAPWGEGRREESVGHWLDSRDATKAARIAREATR